MSDSKREGPAERSAGESLEHIWGPLLTIDDEGARRLHSASTAELLQRCVQLCWRELSDALLYSLLLRGR